jgi:hypothetical protein
VPALGGSSSKGREAGCLTEDHPGPRGHVALSGFKLSAAAPAGGLGSLVALAKSPASNSGRRVPAKQEAAEANSLQDLLPGPLAGWRMSNAPAAITSGSSASRHWQGDVTVYRLARGPRARERR